MNDKNDSHPVRQVLSKIVSEKAIHADQVNKLERFVAEDWIIDQDEVHLLFRVNHAIGDKDEACPNWSDFFVRSVNRLVVMDMNTPGQIDESEGNWLAGLVEKYSVGNETERKLFFDLRNTTSSINGKLGEKLQSYD